MAATMSDVMAELVRDEPEYEAAAEILGEEAAPFLLEIVRDERNEPLLMSKAAYLASFLRGETAAEVLRTGSSSRRPEVRVAVASGLKNALAVSRRELFPKLLEDSDAGVRKVGLQSIAVTSASYMKRRVGELAASDREAFIRDLASKVANNLPDETLEISSPNA